MSHQMPRPSGAGCSNWWYALIPRICLFPWNNWVFALSRLGCRFRVARQSPRPTCRTCPNTQIKSARLLWYHKRVRRYSISRCSERHGMSHHDRFSGIHMKELCVIGECVFQTRRSRKSFGNVYHLSHLCTTSFSSVKHGCCDAAARNVHICCLFLPNGFTLTYIL